MTPIYQNWQRKTKNRLLRSRFLYILMQRDYFDLASKAASCFIKRPLRRAALFGWIVPRLAAISRSRTAARVASLAASKSLAATIAVRAFLTKVRARLR